MVDHQTETEIGTSPALEKAVVSLSEDLRKELKDYSVLSLSELQDSVLKWEEEHGAKLSDKEFEVLEILSYVLGASKVGIEETVGAKATNKGKERAYLESIKAQQHTVRAVIGNLKPDGRPNEAVVRSLSLTTEIFKEYFNFDSPKLTDPGIDTQASNWQGVQGMVTTALLFHEAGWKVIIPKPELDLRYDMDLWVLSPTGDKYAVDLTAKSPRLLDDGGLSKPFYVHRKKIPSHVPKEKAEGLKGYLRINVPPMRHRSSDDFYEDRLSGFPNEGAFSEFRQNIDKLT